MKLNIFSVIIVNTLFIRSLIIYITATLDNKILGKILQQYKEKETASRGVYTIFMMEVWQKTLNLNSEEKHFIHSNPTQADAESGDDQAKPYTVKNTETKTGRLQSQSV